jgi:excisionase family DNA binding protein
MGSVRDPRAAIRVSRNWAQEAKHLTPKRAGGEQSSPTTRSNMNERNVIQNEPELLRVTEAARLLALSRTKVYEMAEREEIPVLRIGTAVRIPRRRLLEWIQAQTIGGRL